MATRTHFSTQIDQLQASVARMGELAGRLVGEAVAALVTKDLTLAHQVIARDEELDALEDEHEEQIAQIMARNQPVASDLRLLIATLHVNASMERGGDLAVNIAQTALRLAGKAEIRPYVDIPAHYDIVRSMWTDAVRAYGTLDEEIAGTLRRRDDSVDAFNENLIVQLIDISRETPDLVYQATNIIGVSRALERVADLAVDIADEVMYARRGEFRHRLARNRRTA